MKRLPYRLTPLFILFALHVPTQGAGGQSHASRYDFYAHGPYRKEVPRPSDILGYEAGATHSTFRDQERVILAIAAAAHDRVRVVEYGKSVEGRPLRLIVVSAPENIARLEAIRADIGRLADPRTLASDAEAERIVQHTPCITWINHCIHGDETASFEAFMWSLYTLAASDAPAIRDALRETVVILNPVFNPDGHERFVVYYNSVAVGSPDDWAFEHEEPWAVQGRFNHYRFDMNRDKLAQSQPETRQETAAFLHWMPQVYADEHGQVENYFFPPNPLAINRQVDRARIGHWTDIFGRANAAAFDRFGWSYVTREAFDFFYAGYLDSWTALSGAIGMTYETDGGRTLAQRRGDGTLSTLRDGIAHHFEATLATIRTAAANRAALLQEFLAFRRGAIKGENVAGKQESMQRIVILPGSDPDRLSELAALLLHVGVEVNEVRTAFQSNAAHSYWAKPGTAGGAGTEKATTQTFPVGSIVVSLAQPQGRVARAFLEPDADFEPEFVQEQLARRARNEKKNSNERKEGYEFYDITAWSLPYAYGLEAYWTEESASFDSRPLQLDAQGHVALTEPSGGLRNSRSAVAYLFRYDRDNAAFLALRLLQEGYKLSVANKPLHADGKDWPRGALIARVSRNPETLPQRIDQLARELGVPVYAVNSGYSDDAPVGLGSESVQDLKRPVVAIVADDMVSNTSYGAIWYLFERQVGLTFTPIRLRNLRSFDLARFNVIILPNGFGYEGALGKSGIDRLKEWIGGGGVLIGLGGGGRWFTDKDAGLSTAAPVGEDEIPSGSKPTTPTAPTTLTTPKRPIDLPGAIFRAHIDPTHFLGYGYEKGEIAVPLSGATFLKPSKQGANVVTFDGGPSRLSGFIWPNNTEELLANTAYVIDEPLGAGHALLYLEDPTFRSFWLGLRRLFLNGILFGPTRTPLSEAK